jgi:hypothetical protein
MKFSGGLSVTYMEGADAFATRRWARSGKRGYAGRSSSSHSQSVLSWGLTPIYMDFPKEDDDLVDVRKRIRIAPGQLVKKSFYGDGGHLSGGIQIV